MPFAITTATKKIAKLNKRLRLLQGGTGAGKTIGTIQVLIDLAQRDKKPTLTSIISESFPHLRRGAMRDFLTIMSDSGYFRPKNWNKTESTYTFETGSQIEFFSADQPDRVRGPRRDRAFINEVNNIPGGYETFDQLEIRTNEFLVADWNPVREFWIYDEILRSFEWKDNLDYEILTYKDNECLDERIKQSIERKMSRKNWWTIFGLGQLGIAEGVIYQGWRILDEIPFEARLERYGLDFGYTNDPTAIVAIYYYNGGWIVDEKVYQFGMSNREIAETLKTYKPALIIADSAEPKSIDEIRNYGLNVTGAEKGRDSKITGIQRIQDQPMSTTKQSVNLLKEYRNYIWMTDKNGKTLNEPEDGNDHCMDALRYAMDSLDEIKRPLTRLDKKWEEMMGRTSPEINVAR